MFGRKVNEFPLAARQVNDIVEAARRTTAGAFKVYDMFLRLGRKLMPGLKSDEPPEMLKSRFDLRELILLHKLCTTYECVDVIRRAMSIFGGQINGTHRKNNPRSPVERGLFFGQGLCLLFKDVKPP